MEVFHISVGEIVLNWTRHVLFTYSKTPNIGGIEALKIAHKSIKRIL